jgi:hypothetical protein
MKHQKVKSVDSMCKQNKHSDFIGRNRQLKPET